MLSNSITSENSSNILCRAASIPKTLYISIILFVYVFVLSTKSKLNISNKLLPTVSSNQISFLSYFESINSKLSLNFLIVTFVISLMPLKIIEFNKSSCKFLIAKISSV